MNQLSVEDYAFVKRTIFVLKSREEKWPSTSPQVATSLVDCRATGRHQSQSRLFEQPKETKRHYGIAPTHTVLLLPL